MFDVLHVPYDAPAVTYTSVFGLQGVDAHVTAAFVKRQADTLVQELQAKGKPVTHDEATRSVLNHYVTKGVLENASNTLRLAAILEGQAHGLGIAFAHAQGAVIFINAVAHRIDLDATFAKRNAKKAHYRLREELERIAKLFSQHLVCQPMPALPSAWMGEDLVWLLDQVAATGGQTAPCRFLRLWLHAKAAGCERKSVDHFLSTYGPERADDVCQLFADGLIDAPMFARLRNEVALVRGCTYPQLRAILEYWLTDPGASEKTPLLSIAKAHADELFALAPPA